MLALETTWQYVVMLLIAFGVGLIGGLGAALIEGKVRLAAKPPETAHWLLNGTAAVLLGGIASVAVLYFFLPTREVVKAEGDIEQFYELVKLVALSLIVGSAGTAFLQSFQQRITSALAAQAGSQAVAGQQATSAIAAALPEQTDQSLDSAKANFQSILRNTAIEPDQIDQVASSLVDEAKKAAAEAIQPQVNAIQKVSLTIGAPLPTGEQASSHEQEA